MSTVERSQPGTTRHAPRPVAWRYGDAMLERLAALAVRAEGPREAIAVSIPFTDEVLGGVPRGTEADVALAVRRARAAQPAWAALPVRERERIVLRFHDLVLANREVLLDLIQLESGKARRDAFEEVLDVANVARYYGVRARRLLRPERRKGAIPLLTRTTIFRAPVGVVGCISPWNYPLNLPVGDLVPALLAGNTALLKPDHQTSFTALYAVDLLYRAGLPRDVLVVVTGEGPELGAPIIDRVDYLMFTGSTRTGRLVATQAAERLIGCSLELGGKNPLLVLADADLDRAVEGAVRGCFVGAGQVCVSTERIYVDQRIHEHFIERFVARTRRLRLGAALDYSAEMGSLTSAKQLTTVESHVQDAVAKGAHALTGGRARPDLGPLFYEPTVLVGVRPGMLAYADETFGPVVAIYPFSSEDEAVEHANDTRFGLSASIWTRDTERGERLARRIRAGMVNINEAYSAAWGSVASPIGGMKESGLDRRHGAEGLLKYTEAQTVAVQRLLPIGPPPGVSAAAWAGAMRRLLGVMRHLPGVR
ncbi:MAG TPA: succinic semialdehyde dehydrogenase [Longimicrobiaceae bacterium]|nr:succinic semialdehyde dehydrogenase [Longimicrobiaceae bacterium]